MNPLQLLNSHLGRAALGAIAGGGGAVVYNQFSDNDINPLLTAGIGAGFGGFSPYIQKYIPEVAESIEDGVAYFKADLNEGKYPFLQKFI